MKIRVYYEDTDAGGVVYHTNYIKYCERARSEKFFAANMPVTDGKAHFVVRSIKADFLKPAKLGDMLEVTTEMLSHKKTSMVILHKIYRDETLLFTAEVLAVYVSEGKPKRISEDVLEFLKS